MRDTREARTLRKADRWGLIVRARGDLWEREVDKVSHLPNANKHAYLFAKIGIPEVDISIKFLEVLTELKAWLHDIKVTDDQKRIRLGLAYTKKGDAAQWATQQVEDEAAWDSNDEFLMDSLYSAIAAHLVQISQNHVGNFICNYMSLQIDL